MKPLFGTFIVLALWSLSALAQEQKINEVGLVIGGTVTPRQSLSSAHIADLSFNGRLALGAEYDRRLVSTRRVAIYGGIDFLASPLDVKLSQSPPDVIGQYTYVFLTPHVRAKSNSSGAFSPRVSFGGGYARFLEKAPAAAPLFRPGTNTGALAFGGGVDTRTALRVLKIPIGFRIGVHDFYSGRPNYNQKVSGNLQNSLAFTGGLLIRF